MTGEHRTPGPSGMAAALAYALTGERPTVAPAHGDRPLPAEQAASVADSAVASESAVPSETADPPSAASEAAATASAASEAAAATSAASVARALERSGWTVARLRRHARECRDAGLPWPHPVPQDERPGVGAAQFAAALAGLLAELGLQGRIRGPAPARPLTPDERRLLAEVPPHHGS